MVHRVHEASQVELVVKNLPANAGDIRDLGSIPGLGRSPGRGHGNPLQFSCLGNPMDRGAWWDYSPYGYKESDPTEVTWHAHAHTHTHTHTHTQSAHRPHTYFPQFLSCYISMTVLLEWMNQYWDLLNKQSLYFYSEFLNFSPNVHFLSRILSRIPH